MRSQRGDDGRYLDIGRARFGRERRESGRCGDLGGVCSGRMSVKEDARANSVRPRDRGR